MTNLKERITSKTVCAILLLGVFTFLFLGAEFLYVNRVSLSAGEKQTVIAQNYALGASAVGFLLYPLFHRFLKRRAKTGGLFILVLAVAVSVFSVHFHVSHFTALITGPVLFLFLGLLGGAVHYMFFKLTENNKRLATTFGISYSLGIILQFFNYNLIDFDIAEVIILSLFAVVELLLLLWALKTCGHENIASSEHLPIETESDSKSDKKNLVTGGLLALLVILMACIFSTLDNAVTMYHAAGTDDIGQWPRLLLAVSGLVAGLVFDIRQRKYMTIIMYCIMLMSVICVVILKPGGSFLIGLIVFYLSTGFFVVFFTTAFMDLACHM